MTPLAAAIRHPPVVWWGAIVYANRRMQGRDAELVPLIEPIAGGDGEVSVYRCSLAAALARAGRLDEARDVLDMFRSEGYPVSESMTWTCSMSELAEAAEIVGDRETAALVLAQADRYHGLHREHRCPRDPSARSSPRAGGARRRRRGRGCGARRPRRDGQPTERDTGVPRPRGGVPRRSSTPARCVVRRGAATRARGARRRRAARRPRRRRRRRTVPIAELNRIRPRLAFVRIG